MNSRAIGALLLLTAIAAGCRTAPFEMQPTIPATLAEVPAVRLNYRYEPDVPGPEQAAPADEQRIAAVQADFDQARPGELLDKTIVSPDKKRILAVYHQPADIQAEFRLDMYTGDGKVLRKITPDTMAVHFPDTIVWSPDSSSVAFVAMIRAGLGEVSAPTPPGVPGPDAANTAVPDNNANVPAADANSANTETAAPPENTAAPPEPTPSAPTAVLTFRSEQIYICDMDGDKTKPLTQNVGLIYFYYVWSPDSSMLAALAATAREWQYLQYQADSKGETFTPMGRPRIVEKNGRERRLDDALTAVQPVWSPDSSKVADAFDTQVRIYDATGNSPTQAAIPLRNQLLLSSQAYDREQQSKLTTDGSNANAVNADANVAAPTPPPADTGATTLPDEKDLVSYNPIVDLEWTADDLLYLQTAYVKRMKNDADSVRSFARWHRLVLTAQASVLQ